MIRSNFFCAIKFAKNVSICFFFIKQVQIILNYVLVESVFFRRILSLAESLQNKEFWSIFSADVWICINYSVARLHKN